MIGLRDMIDRNLGVIISEEDCTFVEVESERSLWEKGQFLPREVMIHLCEGESISADVEMTLYQSQLLTAIRWNTHRVA